MRFALPGLFLVLGLPFLAIAGALLFAVASWLALGGAQSGSPRGYGIVVELLRRRLARRRWLSIGLFAIGLTAVGLVLGTGWVMLGSNLERADRIAAEAAIVGGSAVILALLGGFVALAAYADATRRPDLQLILTGPEDGLRFATRKVVASNKRETTIVVNRPFQPALLAVAISNSADFSARNPSVRLEFFGLVSRQRQNGWVGVSTENRGAFALQWQGAIVQGNWTFQLPSINLYAAIVTSKDTYVMCKLVAEEFKPAQAPQRQDIQLVPAPKGC
jgi:hypothetical protein